MQVKTAEKNGEGGGVFKHPKTPTPFTLPCYCLAAPACQSCSWSPAKTDVLAAKVTRQFDWRLGFPCKTRQWSLRLHCHVSRRATRWCYWRLRGHVAAPTRKRQWWWRHAWASRKKTAPPRNKFQKNPIWGISL